MTDVGLLRLAKPSLDVCLFTNNAKPLIEFWRDRIGLALEDPVNIRDGLVQHRLTCGTAVIKISEQVQPLPPSPPCGYRELLIARAGVPEAEREIADPDGNRVTFVEPGLLPERGIGMRLEVRDVAATKHFFKTALRLPVDDWPSANVAIGTSRLFLTKDPDAVIDPPVEASGWRYVTLQIFDARTVYALAIANGASAGRPPRTLGTIARYALVRDPDGNWIELTQRASLTGPLGPD